MRAQEPGCLAQDLRKSRVSDIDFNSSLLSNSFSDGNETVCSYPNITNVEALRVIYSNVDVLTKNKMLELKDLVKTQNPHIIALTEVYPKRTNFGLIIETYNIPNYELLLADESEGRGVAIYVKKELQPEKIETNFNDVFRESVWCEIRLKQRDKLLVGCLYRSPNSDNNSVQQMLEMLQRSVNKGNSHLLIVGDFNFPEIDWAEGLSRAGEGHISSKFYEGVQDLFLHQHVQIRTRYRENQRPTLLDLVFTNEEGMVDEIEQLPGLDKSDHIVLNFMLNCYISKHHNEVEKFNFNKGNYAAIRESLNNTNWDDLLCGDVDDCWGKFAEILQELKDKNIPKINVNLSVRRNPYADGDALKAIKQKRKCWRKYTHCRNLQTYERYKDARNKATYELRRARYRYEEKVAMNIKSNAKGFWKYVRNNTKTPASVTSLENADGSKTSSDKEAAETLNSHFVSVFTEEDTNTIVDFNSIRAVDPIETMDINDENILNVVSNIQPTKSQGPDNIHPRMIRECQTALLRPLEIIFRRSLNEGKLPVRWKEANITAIHKAGSRHKPENYRPISVTPICCRIMERLIRNIIVEHLEDNNLITKHQHGFRAGRSCTTQLIECIEDWSIAVDEGKFVDVIYLDFRAAFDKVPHQRLLKKVWSYGIRGKIYEWIANFLYSRKQRVLVNGHSSRWESVVSGVPQGSVLGPVLFLIFINDIPEAMNSITKLFADDTKIYRTISSHEDKLRLQEDVQRATDWSNRWQMPFNIKKCKMMQIGLQTQGSDYQISNSEGALSTITSVDSEKDLGVSFDGRLTFNSHVGLKVKKANRNLGLIMKTFQYMSVDMFKVLYKALVRPHLEYACTVWSPRNKKEKRAIESVQRRATRMVSGLAGMSYSERLIRLGFPSLEYRRERADVIQVYKIMNGLDKVDRQKLFPLANERSQQLRGNIHKIMKTRSRTELRRSVFSQRVVDSWNSLPDDVVTAPSLNAFKSRLNKHWASVDIKFRPKCLE